MNAKHTPGPWLGVKHFSQWLISDGDRLIATTAGAASYMGLAHAKRDAANAKLIASAPDLLEVLRKYELPIDINNIALSCIELGSEAVERELQRRAAIAKATGEPQ